jgi:hypothetical protein
MSIIKDPEYLPVFHHIAKNAGTYVLSWAQMLCRKYHLMRGDNLSLHWTSAKIRRALIRLKDDRQLTVIYCTLTDLTGDPNGIFSIYPELEQFSIENKREIVLEKQMEYINSRYPIDSDETTNIIPEDDFLNFIKSGDVIPFCVIVDPINYIKSDNSSHEPNHDCLVSKSFQEYIESDELEDSWFLRSLMDMPDSAIIEPYHLTLAHEGYLKHFRISDISKVDDLINNVFHGVYGIQQSDVEDHVIESNLHRNATPNKLKIKFEDLDPTIQQKFLDRTYWDRKLWKRYREC